MGRPGVRRGGPFDFLGHVFYLRLCKSTNRVYANRLVEEEVLIERGPRVLRAVEIKSSTTYRPSYFDMVSKIAPEIGLGADACSVVYGGEEGFHTSRGDVVPFGESGELTE